MIICVVARIYVGMSRGNRPKLDQCDGAGGVTSVGGLTVGTMNGSNQVITAIALTQFAPPYGSVVTTDKFGGTFGANSKIGFRDMSDGSSTTIVVGERYTPFGSTSTNDLYGDATWVGFG